MFKKYYILFLLSSCLLSCVYTSENSQVQNDHNNISRIERHHQEAFTDLTEKMHLPSITNGVDSFEVRIYGTISPYQFTMFSMRYFDSGWQFSQSYIYFTSKSSSFKRGDTTNVLLNDIVDSVFTKKIYFKGNNKFDIDSLRHTLLDEFPATVDIANTYAPATHSTHIFFEVASKGKYSLLRYECGNSINSHFEMHNKITRVLEFVKKNFDINFLPCTY